MKYGYLLLLILGLGGCFQPIVYLNNAPRYPIDVFYDNQRPERPYEPLEEMEVHNDMPLTAQQRTDKKLTGRGIDMQEKELLLARLTMQAKKLGATALVGVRYSYYTSQTENGYSMKGLAVRYRAEQ